MIRLGLRAEVQRNGPSISWRLATGLNKLKTGKPVQLPGAGLARVDTLPGVQQQGGALASREELLHEAHVDNAQVLNAVVGRGKVGGMCSGFISVNQSAVFRNLCVPIRLSRFIVCLWYGRSIK